MHLCSPCRTSMGPRPEPRLYLFYLLSPFSLARGKPFSALVCNHRALCLVPRCLGTQGEPSGTVGTSPSSRSLSDDVGGVTPGSATSVLPALQLLPSKQDGDTSAAVKSKSTAELADSIKNMKGIHKLILKF